MSKSSTAIVPDANQLKEISMRLDAMIKPLALSLPENVKQSDKIRLLSESGFQPRDRGSMLGMTANAPHLAE